MRLAASTVALAMALPWLAAEAATFKWIDADGRVNYGDRPPDGVRADAVRPPPPPPAPGEYVEPPLPLPLRSAVSRNPVTLYSTRECGACDALRTHLSRRGIPFEERVVQSERDADAFRQLGFPNRAIPSLTVGRDRLTGYDQQRVDSILDAAGYPRTSLLPAGWRAPPARLLAAPREADEPGGQARPAGARMPSAAPSPDRGPYPYETQSWPGVTPPTPSEPPSRPAGIRF